MPLYKFLMLMAYVSVILKSRARVAIDVFIFVNLQIGFDDLSKTWMI